MGWEQIRYTYNVTFRFDGTKEPCEVLWEGTDTLHPQYRIEDDEQTQIFEALMELMEDRDFYKSLVVDTVIIAACAGYMEYSSYSSMDGTEYESEPFIEWWHFNVLDVKQAKMVLDQIDSMNEQLEDDHGNTFQFT